MNPQRHTFKLCYCGPKGGKRQGLPSGPYVKQKSRTSVLAWEKLQEMGPRKLVSFELPNFQIFKLTPIPTHQRSNTSQEALAAMSANSLKRWSCYGSSRSKTWLGDLNTANIYLKTIELGGRSEVHARNCGRRAGSWFQVAPTTPVLI